MLSETKFNTLKSEIKNYSREELIWFNGYLAGLLEVNQTAHQTAPAIKEVKIKPTIIYGTETGNSKRLASQLLAVLKKNKIQAKAIDAAVYPVEKIEKEDFIISIISTQGEGELPVTATDFFEKLNKNLPNLNKAKFAVLGLGDTSYPLFCKAAEDFDFLFDKLGAQRVLPLLKADVDYNEVANNWFDQLLNTIQNTEQAVPSSLVLEEKQAISHKKNYEGTVSHKIVLNDRGSNKETYHIEISTEENVFYEPGDAIGFYPKNKQEETTAIAKFLKEEERFLELENKNIKGLTSKSIANLAQLLNIDIAEEKLDLFDLLEKYGNPDLLTFDKVLELLHPISPRLYSISSSNEAHNDEVHITVSLDRFIANGKQKKGLCSDFLADFPVNETVSFYVHKNQNFKLPNDDKDIIMIGPGTGIAPFRSFLAHRDAIGAEGRNWLIFGEQHFVSDFYYQTEIQEWLSTGVLTKLDTAFSRDQKHKIYVQDRLKENAGELVSWIENGAHLYVCGQKSPMSTDVEQTLLEIISSAKNTNIEDAQSYLENLEIEGRYTKDVY